MDSESTLIDGVRILSPQRHADARGWFMETWTEAQDRLLPAAARFVQDNHSLSLRAGTLRGLHFQRPPHVQAKLVRVIRGRALDIVVDLRGGSQTFGRHVAVELCADRGRQIFVPAGFAHGLMTLEPDTEILYKVTAPHVPSSEGGLLWRDPALGIAWPTGLGEILVNDRDRAWPGLAALAAANPFADMRP